MNKNPIFYNEDQMEEIEQFMDEQWNTEGKGMICHELRSDYVHTDVHVMQDVEETALVTCGVGARKMAASLPKYARAEFILYASPDLKGDMVENNDLMTACAELTNISKYPFREDTWIGPGHTINASDDFRETFGYPYFLFLEYPVCAKVSGIGEIRYLIAIPVYEDEVEEMTKRREYATFLKAYFDYFENPEYARDIFRIDSDRPHLVDQQ